MVCGCAKRAIEISAEMSATKQTTSPKTNTSCGSKGKSSCCSGGTSSKPSRCACGTGCKCPGCNTTKL